MNSSFSQLIQISRSGMMFRMLDIDVVGNNLANVNTVGYKKQRLNFSELLSQAQSNINAENLQSEGTTEFDAIKNQHLNGILVSSTQMFTEQGALVNTGRNLDIAISGEGFLGFTLPNGEIGYTREGVLNVDAELNLVNGSGYHLVWDGDIPDGAYDIKIDKDGTLSAMIDGETQDLGQIPLHRFGNPSALEGYGNNMWIPNEASGEAESGIPNENNFGFIQSETLENSNIDYAEEFTRLITLQRGFEMSLRTLQQSDEMMGQAIQMRRS